MYDPGHPSTGPELREALGRLLAEGHAFLATLTTDEFFLTQGEHWSPAGFAGQYVLTVATFPPPEPTSGKKRR